MHGTQSFSFTRKSSGDKYTEPCDQRENACFVFSLFFFFFLTGSLYFKRSCYAAENGLKPLILLPLPPKCCHYKSTPPCSALGIVMIYTNLCISNIGD